MKQSTFLTLEIDIASNARVSEFPPLAVPALMLSESHTLPRTRRQGIVWHGIIWNGRKKSVWNMEWLKYGMEWKI